MATASFHVCTWDGNNGDLSLQYDDVSLLASPHPALPQRGREK